MLIGNKQANYFSFVGEYDKKMTTFKPITKYFQLPINSNQAKG